MIGKSPNRMEQDLFRPLLSDFIDMGHELVFQMEAGGMKMPSRLAYDRGGRGSKEVWGMQVIPQESP